MASIFDITLSDDEDPQGIDSEDSDDGFKVCDNFTKGQLISEWLIGVFNFPKNTTQKFGEFLP